MHKVIERKASLTSADKLQANRRGIVAMLLAMMFFVTNDALLKIAAATLPTGQIMALRGLLACAMAFGLVVATGGLRAVGRLASPMVALRAGLEVGVAFLYITALAYLPLANITAILLSTPIVMTLAAAVFGMEQVGWRRFAATAVGFAGVVLIVRPSSEGFDVYALVALGAAFLVAGRDMATRFVAGDVPSLVVTLSTTCAVALAGFAIGFGEEWRVPDARETALLAATAALVTLGNLSIVVAFRGTDVSVVSPFRFTVAVMSIVLGYLIFGDLPDALALAGIALIVGSGLYTIHRERARALAAARQAGPAPRAP